MSCFSASTISFYHFKNQSILRISSRVICKQSTNKSVYNSGNREVNGTNNLGIGR